MVLGRDRKGVKVSITTDTRPTKEIPQFVENSDCFICEGTYGSDDDIHKAIKNKHMTFSEAAKLAQDGKVKNLLLTHFGTAMNEPEMYLNNAKEIFENTIIGYNRYNVTLNFEN